jgi:nucleoid-associated protein YgaU
VGKDYRIGLVAGSILAGVALVWVATRPSLSPRPLPAPSSQDNDQAPLRADNFMTSQDTSSASEANKPKPDESGGRKTQDREQPAALRSPSSGAPDPAVRDGNGPVKTARFHVVRQGETLSAISQQYYGSANDWRKILAANEKTIKDANKIAPGTKLIIPE